MNLSVPPGALLQLVRSCNYTCSHCSQAAPHVSSVVPAGRVGVSPAAEHLRALCQIGIRRIRFTGGEPFLHPQVRELAILAHEMNVELSFVTNASRVGAEQRAWLREIGPVEVWISFYGYPPETHDEICGRRGAFRAARLALEGLRSDGHRIGLHYPLELTTAAGAAPFAQLARSLGVARLKMMQLFEQGRARADFERRRIHDDALGDVLMGLRDGCITDPSGMDLAVSVRSGQGRLFERASWELPPSVGCHAGLDNYWTLDIDGWIYPCCLFLDSRPARVAHVRDPALRSRPTAFDNAAFARHIGVEHGPDGPRVDHCPATDPTGQGPSVVPFICPLTYARPRMQG